MSETWSTFDMVEQRSLATGKTSVVETQVDARARATGQRLRFPILQTIHIVGGRIAEVRPYYWDAAVIAAACR